jgi:sulfotransferase family protein
MSGPDGTVKVLYIAGSGRSGSTILDRTLGQVDGFFSAGELCNLWGRGLLARRRCGCGVPVPDCPVWGPILGEAFGGVDQIDAERLAAATGRRLRAGSVPRLFLDRRGRQRAAGDGYQAALAHLYRAVVHQTGCRVIVDSSKSPVYARLVAAIPGVEVAVVHLVRDPRATAFSFLRNKRLPDFGDDRLMQRQHPLVSARRWSLWQAATELLWRRQDRRYLRLRYEDFVYEPQPAILRITALVGETPAALPFSGPATVRMTTTHSVSGNPNRFGTGEVELCADEEWRRAMRTVDRGLVTALTWPLLLHYRYPLCGPRGGGPMEDRARDED